MKAYKAVRSNTVGVVATVEVVNSESMRTYDLLHHVKHSPTGFEYGYAGSGPSDFARCILLDMGYPKDEVDRWYQDFKRQFIEPADREKDLIIYEDAIKLWWEQKHSDTAT